MESTITQFEAYLLTERRLASNTVRAYINDVEQFSLFVRKKDKKASFKRITLQELKAYLQFLKFEQAASARSMSRKISSLKVLYGFLHTHFGVPNITGDLVFPKLEKRLPQFLSEEEIGLLLKSVRQDTSAIGMRNQVMLTLLYTTGMRISELVTLTIANVQLEEGFILVHGKGGKDRLVPLPEEAIELVHRYLRRAHGELIGIKRSLRASDYLFPVVYGGKVKHLTRQTFWMTLKKIAADAGITQEITPHKLRHSLATHLLRKGADLRSLQLLLGHENLATVQIYTHLDTGYLRELYDQKHPRAR